MSITTSIVLPTYEESGHIQELLSAIEKELQQCAAVASYEIVVVDDSPSQSTVQAITEYQQKNSRHCVVVHHRTNSKGLADAVRFGIDHSKHDRCMVMDSDFNHHPRYLPIIAELLQHYDFVIGSRYIVGGDMLTNKARYIGSFMFNSMIRFFLRTRIHDNLSGFLGIKKTLYKKLAHDNVFFGYGDYFIRMIYNALMFKPAVIEIPVIYELRPSGASKTNLFKCLITYSLCILDILINFRRKIS